MIVSQNQDLRVAKKIFKTKIMIPFNLWDARYGTFELLLSSILDTSLAFLTMTNMGAILGVLSQNMLA